jgi:glycogen debranching enzyme
MHSLALHLGIPEYAARTHRSSTLCNLYARHTLKAKEGGKAPVKRKDGAAAVRPQQKRKTEKRGVSTPPVAAGNSSSATPSVRKQSYRHRQRKSGFFFFDSSKLKSLALRAQLKESFFFVFDLSVNLTLGAQLEDSS